MATLTIVPPCTPERFAHDEFAQAVARLLPPVPSTDAARSRASRSHPAFGRSTKRLSVVLGEGLETPTSLR